MKTAEQATKKWTDSTSNGEATWADNLQSTTKPIVSAAIAARDRMQANFNRATQPGGIWESKLSKVGDGGIKQAAQTKKANYSTGVQHAKDRFATAISKILAYESAGMAGLAAIPKGWLAQSKARANYWIEYMAAGKGTLGA